MLTPLTLCVISRILRWNRSRDFGAILRLMSGPVVKLNPRNFRSCGRATALFASLTADRAIFEQTAAELFEALAKRFITVENIKEYALQHVTQAHRDLEARRTV